jgi:hypothetical protein
MKLKFTLWAAALVLTTSAAQANLIQTDVNISATNPTVQYVNFKVTSPGLFNIQALGDPTPKYHTNPITYNTDPEIFLFSLSLLDPKPTPGSDYPGNFESYIEKNLGEGSYIIAVSGYDFTLEDALNGSNPDISDIGIVHINIQSANGGFAQLTTVPAPTATPTPVVTAVPTPTPVVTAVPTPTPVVTAVPTPTSVVTPIPTPITNETPVQSIPTLSEWGIILLSVLLFVFGFKAIRFCSIDTKK